MCASEIEWQGLACLWSLIQIDVQELRTAQRALAIPRGSVEPAAQRRHALGQRLGAKLHCAPSACRVLVTTQRKVSSGVGFHSGVSRNSSRASPVPSWAWMSSTDTAPGLTSAA